MPDNLSRFWRRSGRGIANDAASIEAVKSLVIHSMALRKSKRFGSAEATVQQGLRKYPNSLKLLCESAEIASARKDWPEAIKRWQAVLDKYKTDPPPAVFANLAKALSREESYQTAQSIVDEALQLYQDSPMLLAASAEIASARKDWPEAIKRWQKTLEQYDDDPPAWVFDSLASAQRLGGNLSDAETTINAGLKIFRDNVSLRIGLCEVSNNRKDWPEAIKRWQAVLTKYKNSSKIDDGTRSYIRFNISVAKRLNRLDDYNQQIKKYARAAGPKKIAIYTSFSKDYDVLKPPEKIDSRFDYIAYVDSPIDGLGIFDVRPLSQPDFDPPRATRYPKTHPHTLLRNYDVAVWMDASLMITGDLMPLIEDFLKSGKPIASSVHSVRKSIYEEFEACVDLQKDDYKTMKSQIDYYKMQGFKSDKLSENGLLIFDLHHERLGPALELWWDQICHFSKRDQLSFDFSLTQYGLDWYPVIKPPYNIRNHPAFVVVPHKTDYRALDQLISLIKTS